MHDDNVELVTWSNAFSCGVKLIDDQHKALIDLINEMFNHVTGNEEEEHEYFHEVIYEAVKYIKIHMATEEKILSAVKFSGYTGHMKEHNTFIRTVSKNIKDHEAGKKVTLSLFTKFLKDWVISHIEIMDKQYFEYLRHIASRKADGKLGINSSDVAIFC